MSHAKCDQTREPHNIWRSLESSPSNDTHPHPGLRIFSMHAYKIVGTQMQSQYLSSFRPAAAGVLAHFEFQNLPPEISRHTLIFLCEKAKLQCWSVRSFDAALMMIKYRFWDWLGLAWSGSVNDEDLTASLSSFQQLWMYRQTWQSWWSYDFKTTTCHLKRSASARRASISRIPNRAIVAERLSRRLQMTKMPPDVVCDLWKNGNIKFKCSTGEQRRRRPDNSSIRSSNPKGFSNVLAGVRWINKFLGWLFKRMDVVPEMM